MCKHLEEQDCSTEKLQQVLTYSRHFIAARDYLKISRAATDTTGASLTILNIPSPDMIHSVVGEGEFP